MMPIMMRVSLAALLSLSLPLTVKGVDCTLCKPGEAPANSIDVIPFLNQGLKTCGDVFLLGTFDATSDQCNFLSNLGQFACKCDENVDPNLGDSCTICPDGTSLPQPNLNVLPGLSCLELQSNAGRNSDATCAGYQRAFGPYCGCSNTEADALTCRLCTGSTILPRPFQRAGSQTCLGWEFFSNLSNSCSQARADHGAACCSAIAPTTPNPTTSAPQQPNPSPTTPPTMAPIMTPNPTDPIMCFLCETGTQPAEPNAIISVDGTLKTCQAAFEQGDLNIADVDICSFTKSLGNAICMCTDEPIEPQPPSAAPIDRGDGCFLCAGASESPFDPFAQLVLDNGVTSCQVAFTSGDLGLSTEQCNFIQNIGREICICSEGTPPEPNFCPLCENGSIIPNPQTESLPGLTCAELQVDARRDFPENCPFYQGGIGSYCGCDNPIAAQSSCRICGDGTLLPRPRQTGEGLGDLSCIQHEFLASLTRTCSSAQSLYQDICCEAVVVAPICFSGTNQVQVMRHGAPAVTTIPMHELQIGDYVMDSAESTYSRVYSFGHYHQEAKATFLQIKVADSKNPLEISSDHMVYLQQQRRTSKEAVPAGSLSIGDSLVLVIDGNTSLGIVNSIQTIVRHGVFAPFTESGNIVVNGILASSFVSMETDSGDLTIFGGTKLVSYQWLAHMFQAPHRLFCTVSKCTSESYNEKGISQWVAGPLEAALWWTRQNPFVKLVLLLPTLILMLSLYAIEGVIRHSWLSVMVGVFLWIAHNKMARRKTRNFD